jgi:hypothetical protein
LNAEGAPAPAPGPSFPLARASIATLASGARPTEVGAVARVSRWTQRVLSERARATARALEAA